jgi:hypothetical protein
MCHLVLLNHALLVLSARHKAKEATLDVVAMLLAIHKVAGALVAVKHIRRQHTLQAVATMLEGGGICRCHVRQINLRVKNVDQVPRMAFRKLGRRLAVDYVVGRADNLCRYVCPRQITSEGSHRHSLHLKMTKELSKDFTSPR